VFREIVGSRANDVRVTALGFSQAAATVARWVVHGTSKLDRVILWAGLLPPEIDPQGPARERLASTDLYLVAGTSDDMLDAAELRRQRDALEKTGVAHRVLEFDGGHRIDRDTLQGLAT
jgi:predicted esterase